MPRRGLPSEGAGEVVDVIKRIERRATTLEKPDGSQLGRALAKVQQLILDLPGQVSAAIAALGSIDVSGSVTAGTTVYAGTGLISPGAVTTNLDGMAGARTPVWMHDATGTFGYSPSTAFEKTDIEDAPLTIEQFAAVMPRVYRYSAQVALQKKTKGYRAPVEIGLLAEELDAAGLGSFVVWNDDGTPKTIDYATFGAVASVVIARHLMETNR